MFHVAAVANNSPQSILEAIAIVGTPANLDIAAPIATANFKILKRIGACFATRDAAARPLSAALEIRTPNLYLPESDPASSLEP